MQFTELCCEQGGAGVRTSQPRPALFGSAESSARRPRARSQRTRPRRRPAAAPGQTSRRSAPARRAWRRPRRGPGWRSSPCPGSRGDRPWRRSTRPGSCRGRRPTSSPARRAPWSPAPAAAGRSRRPLSLAYVFRVFPRARLETSSGPLGRSSGLVSRVPPCHILPPSEIPWRLFLAVSAGSEGEYLFRRIGWKGRIWQLWCLLRRKPRCWPLAQKSLYKWFSFV